jgi:NADH-quinone oxidoreductase subunit H
MLDLGVKIFNVLVFPGLLFVGVMGLLLFWLHRKLIARFQWRVGPPFYQTFADFFKLMFKETIVPKNASKAAFISAPLIALASVVAAALLIPIGGREPVFGFTGDLIVLIYLLMIPAMAIIVGGISSGNPFSGTGAGRKATLLIAYELGLIISVLALAVGAGSLELGEISAFSARIGPLPCLLAAIAFLLCIQVKLGLIPFDIPEAKTEIMAGVYTEYSGVALGIFKLAKAMLLFVLVSLMVTLFFPGPLTGIFALDVLWHLAKVAIIVAIMSVIAAANPRLRIDQALRFYWVYVIILASLNLLLIVVYF